MWKNSKTNIISFKKSKHTDEQNVHKANLCNVNKGVVQISGALTCRCEDRDPTVLSA